MTGTATVYELDGVAITIVGRGVTRPYALDVVRGIRRQMAQGRSFADVRAEYMADVFRYEHSPHVGPWQFETLVAEHQRLFAALERAIRRHPHQSASG